MVYKHKEDVKELGKKVDVLRLITYQTYEHDVFVRAQRKVRIWLTLLGSEPVAEPIEQHANEENENGEGEKKKKKMKKMNEINL